LLEQRPIILKIYIMENQTRLFPEFQPVSKADWLAKIEKDLKGRPIADLMADFGGVPLSPFQHSEDLAGLPKPITDVNSCEIGEDFVIGSYLKAANQEVLEALGNGVEAPCFVLDKILSANELELLLAGIDLDLVSVHFHLSGKEGNTRSQIDVLFEFAEEKQIDFANWRMSISREEALTVNDFGDKLKTAGNGMKLLTVNGLTWFSESDTSAELAQIVSAGEQHLADCLAKGWEPAWANGHLQFEVGVGKNYFLNIAKLRALKLLWANVQKAYGLGEEVKVPISVRFPSSSQSENANTNMIAATTQAMSSITGGASRLTVMPSDAGHAGPTGFSKRIARNVQHVLQMESHFGMVADPSAGAYFIETLTRSLAERAWGVFQKT